MILKSIRIENFKKIVDAEINLEKGVQLLVGENNAGKSSFIQGIVLGYQSLLRLYENERIKFKDDFIITQDLLNKIENIKNECEPLKEGLLELDKVILDLTEKKQHILNARIEGSEFTESQKDVFNQLQNFNNEKKLILEKISYLEQKKQPLDEQLSALSEDDTDLEVKTFVDRMEIKGRRGVSTDEFPFIVADYKSLFNVGLKLGSGNSRNSNFCTFNFDKDRYIKISASLIGKTFSVNILDCSYDITEEEFKQFLEKPIVLIPSFFSITVQEDRKYPARYTSLLKMGNYNHLFRNVLLDLKDQSPRDFEKLVHICKELFGVEDLNITFDPMKDEFIDASYYINSTANKRKMDVSTLGMGALQFIQVFAQVLSGRPSLILLDEPDAHLHANLQVRIIEELNKLAYEKEMSFVISTHSKDIINRMDYGKIIQLNSQGEVYSILEQRDIINLLEGLGATTEEILGVSFGKRLVLVEGIDDAEILPYFYIKLNSYANFNNKVKFVQMGGRSYVLENRLENFIGNDIFSANNFKKMAVIDRDFRSEELHNKDLEFLTNKGFLAIGWSRKEFENYFIDPPLLAKFLIDMRFSELESDILIEKIKEIINQVYEDEKLRITMQMALEMADAKRREVMKESNTVIKELGQTETLKYMNEAQEILKNTEIIDIVPGKEVLNRIRINFSNRPFSNQEFIKLIIDWITPSYLHEDLKFFIEQLNDFIEE